MARFKLDVAEFCASCSIHGLGKAAKASATKWHKFGWLVVTLISCACAIYMLQRTFVSWANEPLETEVAVLPISQVPFPVVTVCPNSFSQGRLHEFIFDRFNVTDDIRHLLSPMVGAIMVKRFSDDSLGVRYRLRKVFCVGFEGCKERGPRAEHIIKKYEASYTGAHDQPDPAFYKFTNLVLLAHYRQRGMVDQVFRENLSLPLSEEADVILDYPACMDDAVADWWERHETYPTMDEAIGFCLRHVDPVLKRFVLNGTVGDLDHHVSCWKSCSKGELSWYKDVAFRYMAYHLRYDSRLPRLSRLGSFVQFLRTKCYFPPRGSMRQSIVPVRYPESCQMKLDLSELDDLERRFMKGVLGVQANVTFYEFMTAFATFAYFTHLQNSKSDVDRLTTLRVPAANRQVMRYLLSNILRKPYTGDDEAMEKLLLRHLQDIDLFHEKKTRYFTKSNMIPFCFWHQKMLGIDHGFKSRLCDEFHPVWTDSGICYNFNNRPMSEVFREELLPQQRRDSGHTLRMGRSGKKNGFFFLIATKDEYADDTRRFPGASYIIREDVPSNTHRIMLGPPGSVAVTREGSEFMATEVKAREAEHTPFFRIYQIGVTATVTRANENLRILPVSARQCLFEDEGSLKLFKIYSAENCFLEYRLKMATAECGCVPWNYADLDGADICDPDGGLCFETSMIEISARLSMSDSGCLKACNGIQYDFELDKVDELNAIVSQDENYDFRVFGDDNETLTIDIVDKWDEIVAEYLQDEQNRLWDPVASHFLFDKFRRPRYDFHNHRAGEADDVNLLTDMVGVNVYFKSSSSLEIKMRSRIKVEHVLGHVGGTLGLFLGVSIISCIEVIVFAARTSWRFARTLTPSWLPDRHSNVTKIT